MFKKLIVLPLFALFAVGCNLKEDLSDCGILRLNLRFTYNTQQTDMLETEVRSVRFYTFDESGLLVRIVEADESDVERGRTEVEGLPAGKYTFVAWGGSGADIADGGFIEAHMNDAATHDHELSALPGSTTLEEFYMMLDYAPLPAEIRGDIAPRGDTFDDLYYSVVEEVEVFEDRDQTVDFDFIRNTNVLRVTVTGLEHLANYNPTRAASPDQPLHVWAIGKNGRYRWDNTIDAHAREVRYEPPCTTMDAGSMQVDIKTLRLDLDRHTGSDPIKLYVVNPATGRNMTYPLDIMDAIGQVQDGYGRYLYRTQEAIDREYIFPIEMSITPDLEMKIFINDWEIINLTPIVD